MSSMDATGEVQTIDDGIMAMVEDDGTVITLLKRDPDSGAVYRHDGAWMPLVDPTVLDDLSFVGVTADAEAVYDTHESKDELVSIGEYIPSANGPYWPYAVTISNDLTAEDEEESEVDDDARQNDNDSEEVENDEESLTASVLLRGPEDLANAILAAIENPEIRWYVERRVAALGLEVDLPWQAG